MSKAQAMMDLVHELRSLQRKYVDDLSDDQSAAVRVYQGMGPEINHYLRMVPRLRGSEEGRRTLEQAEDALNFELADSGMPEDTTIFDFLDSLDTTIEEAPRSPEMMDLYRVIRGLRPASLRGRQEGYLSTSVSPYGAMDAGSSSDLSPEESRDLYTLMEMTVGPDEPFLFVGGQFDPHFASEQEVLFPRKRKMERLGHVETPEEYRRAFKRRREMSPEDRLNDLMIQYLITKKRGGPVNVET